ncbi:rhodanese-like domain-containing protein [Chloroflexota bacterium]
MNIKITIVGLLFLLGLLLVVGCSPEGSSTTPTPTPSPTPKPTNPSGELPPSSYLPEVPRIGVEEVKSKLDAGINLVIIDSRSENSYDQSHIAGAISIPSKTMAEPYSDFDGYDEIVTYCT